MANAPGNYLLSCDWGTSSFRMRLFNAVTGQLLAETTSAEGIAVVYRRWNELQTVSRADFYREVLKKSLEALSGQVSFPLAGIPLVISGMASSSLGIKELPYAFLPFSLDGRDALTVKIGPSRSFPHEILLVSGVKSNLDVMRGEETQLLGLAAPPDEGMLFGNDGADNIGTDAATNKTAADIAAVQETLAGDNTAFIFPGTHSKHIFVRGGVLTDFETYVTGEMFQLLAGHSILRETLEDPGTGDMSEADVEAFRMGLLHPGASNLLQSVFSVRTNYLFGKLERRANFYFLSGLLTGAELGNLKKGSAGSLVLCGGRNVSRFYELALQELELPGKIIIISPETADLAASRGHIALARRCLK